MRHLASILITFLIASLIPAVAFAAEAAEKSPFVKSLQELAAILILLATVMFVVARLPKNKSISHAPAYERRRRWNWLALGFIYAFLYMGRYNLTVSKYEFGKLNLMDTGDFGVIFGIGTLVYAFAFLINGPLTDRFGARLSILTGAGGAIVANILLGIVSLEAVRSGGAIGPMGGVANAIAEPFFHAFVGLRAFFGISSGNTTASPLLPALSILYAVNMYFQAFGAVAIVKGNAPWFHVDERGVFGGIFGILISLGVYFAYDWNGLLLHVFKGQIQLVFFVPAAILAVVFLIGLVVIRNSPAEAGFRNFLTGDATAGEDDKPSNPIRVFAMMFKNPIIMTIAAIEFCSGFLRQAIMQWGYVYGKATGLKEIFVMQHWGLLLCCAGILGGMFAGTISDHLFESRRAPVAAVLYAGMVAGSLIMCLLIGNTMLMWVIILMSLAIIGVHGMLSGTMSMDFGGAKNAGIAVGIIDGAVYLGTAAMSFLYAWRLPEGDKAKDSANWSEWPLWMIPLAVIGLVLAYCIRNAKPEGKGAH